MIFNWDSLNLLWHIMISTKKYRGSETYIIAACTDLYVINKRVPGNLGRHVDTITKKNPSGVESGYPHDNIELKYSNICPGCIKLYDPEKIKFELIVLKLKGQK